MSPHEHPGSAEAQPSLDLQGAIDVWRARGAATADPVRFGVIEALARRAATQQGQVRGLLMRRIEELLAELATVERHAPSVSPTPDKPTAQHSALAGLSELIDRLGRSPASHVQPSPSLRTHTARPAEPTRATSLSPVAAPDSLKSVTAFKGTWSRLRAEQRLRQALDQVPAMAGPLNSSHLVNRALQAMHDVSPEYLDAFMSHIDTLLWLEQASGGGIAPRPATPTEGQRRARARSARKA